MPEPAIAVLPYGQTLGPHLASRPISELIWPLGCPARLRDRTVGNMEPRDHLIVFPKTSTHFLRRRGTKAKISLILGEPSAIHRKHLALLRFSHGRFWRVLSFNETLLASIPNGAFFPLGTTWVPEWRDLRPEKTAMCSLIASSKRDTTGHRLRHQIAEWVRDTAKDVELLGRGYRAFNRKAEGLVPYRYSVVIENMREQNYFSEKLVDAVLCDTVPIYWGCPNLDRFIDPSGIIQCQTAEDIKRALVSMSKQDFARRLPGLQAIKPVLSEYCDLEKRAAIVVRASLLNIG